MKLQNKRLNEKKAQNADKLNKLNSLIKEEWVNTIEYDWENPQQEDKEPYWLSNEELRLMADKLIKRFGNEEEFEDFYYNAQEYAEGYISEDALAAFAVCDIDEMNDEETYNKAIDEFIAAVWDIKDEDYHLTESMKKAKKKLMKESKELRLIDSVEVTVPEFSEIGYFGEGSWYEAMEFAKHSIEGWHVPIETEAIKMDEEYRDILKNMCKDDGFYFWTSYNGPYNDEATLMYVYKEHPKMSSCCTVDFKKNIHKIFLIKRK